MEKTADYLEISLLPVSSTLRFVTAILSYTIFYTYKMTKLTEWIVFAGLAFSIWITLLTDILPLKVSYKAKEVIWPVSCFAKLHVSLHHQNISRDCQKVEI